MHCLISKSDFSSRDAEQSTRAEKPGEAANEIARTPTPDLTFFLCACSFIVLCEIDMNLCTIVQHEREAISGAPRKVLHTIQRPPFAVSARLAQFVSANLCLIGELGLRSFHVASSAFVMAAGFEKVFSRWKNISRVRLVSPRRSHFSSP